MRYFVSYHFNEKDGSGFGNAIIKRDSPITPSDIRPMQECLQKAFSEGAQVIILNFIHLEA